MAKLVKSVSRLFVLLLGTTLMAGVFIEITFGIVNFFKRDSLNEWRIAIPASNPYRENTTVGFRLRPNLRGEPFTVYRGVKKLYTTFLTTDEIGRRVTAHSRGAFRTAVFMGGSCTLGLGADDNQTIPASFARLAPDFRAYNYGDLASSARTMLSLLREDDFSFVNQESPLLIYTFIPDHLRRDAGSMVYSQHPNYLQPYFYLNAEGELIRDESLEKGRWWLTKFYQLLWKSETLKFRRSWDSFDLPRAMGPQDVDLSVKLIATAAREWKEKFPNGKFLVVLLPRYERFDAVTITAKLAAEGVPYLNLLDREIPSIPLDGHPSAEGYALIATEIYKFLENEARNRPK